MRGIVTRVMFFNPEQYVDFENEAHNFEIRLPILKSGIVTEHADFVYQRYFVMHGPDVLHGMALKQCESFRPDVVVYMPSWHHQCPRIETLVAIRRLGIPILTIISDSFHVPEAYKLDLFEVSDGFCILNSLTNYCRYRYWAETENMAKMVSFCQGHNVLTEFFRPLDLEQNLDVLILGSLYRRRVGFAQRLHPKLSAHGIALQALGGNFHDLLDSESGNTNPQAGPISKRRLPWPQYLAAINSAKICVTPRAVDDRGVIIGKIFEFLASGAFCAVERDAGIFQMTKGADLAMFSSDEEFVDLAGEAIGDPVRRKERATAAREWYLRTFDYRRFWRETVIAATQAAPAPAILPQIEAEYRRVADTLAASGTFPTSRDGWLKFLFPAT